MPATNLHEERIALRGPNGCEVTDSPDGEPDQPEAQAEANGSGQRPVHDRNGARRAAEQNVLGQRPVDWDRKARHRVELFEDGGHYTKTPPPNEKNDKKKLDAAKAMLSPNTI